MCIFRQMKGAVQIFRVLMTVVYAVVFSVVFVLTIPILLLVKFLRIFGGNLHRKVLTPLVKLWAKFTVLATLSRVKVRGRENLPSIDGNLLYVANHQSFFDIPVIMGWIDPRTRFVAKKSLFSIPLLGWWMREIGCISVSRRATRGELSAFGEIANKLSEGAVLVVFPEGTRSRTGELLPFKSSVLQPAIDAASTIVPLAIVGTRKIMPPGKILISPASVKVRVGKPIRIDPEDRPDRKKLALQLRNAIEEMLRE